MTSNTMKIVVVFPGQGSQKVGMGKDFYETSPQARAVFDKADEVLNRPLSRIMFEGPAEELTATENCQVAILTMSLAALAAVQAAPHVLKEDPAFAAGLSLGEYSALCAAGALTLEDALLLVQQRARLMEEACRAHPGAMAAIIGLDADRLEAICRETGAEIANYNSPQQIVLTGAVAHVEAAVEQCRSAGARNCVRLEVSGAFHSSLMQSAEEKFAAVLETIDFRPPRFPVISNVDGRPETDPDQIRTNLARQITSSVQWVRSVEYMRDQGAGLFLEIGPGRVLTGLIRKIDRTLKFLSIETPQDLSAVSCP